MAGIFNFPGRGGRKREGSEEPAAEEASIQTREDLPVTERRGSWWFLVTAIAAAILLGIGGLGLIWLLARAIAVLILGVTLAAAIYPIIQWLERFLSRVMAVVLVYVLLFAMIGGVLYVALPLLVGQVTSFSNALPGLLDHLQGILGVLAPISGDSLRTMIANTFADLGTMLVSLPVAIVASILDILVIIFLSVYALIDLPDIQRFVNSMFPDSETFNVNRLLARMAWSMGGYFRGAAINGVIIGLLTYIGMMLIGVQFPLILGLIAGLLELVPVIGPLIAAVPMILIAYTQAPTLALLSLVYVIAMHQFEGHILVPNIMRSQTEVSQLFIIIALFAGFSVGGILGSLTAIPLAAALWVFMDEVVAPPVRKQTGAPPHKDEILREREALEAEADRQAQMEEKGR